MDACTASTLRTILVITVVAMALAGLWNTHTAYTCRTAADLKGCRTKWMAVSAGAIAAGIALTTLVIVRANRVAALPSTTDLMANVA